jgi:glutamate-1-semialdehyde 2,1-aminomutase
MDHGLESKIYDVDGNDYIDYVMSWGPLLFGHAPAPILKAIEEAAKKGTSFGASTAAEVELARKISEAVPGIEKVRLVSSGTEAVMSAVRVARGFTGRNKVVKFEGNYHGHSDGFLSKSGSGLVTLGLPDSAGVPPGLTQDTITLPYNDVRKFRTLMNTVGPDAACVILEPVAGNMGVVPPTHEFLDAVRQEATKHGAVLIFDEVISGFRLAPGGAQELYGVTPDLTTLGKIIGGGLPLAAYGGRSDIMDVVAPLGPVYQAGTLSGNPLAVAAGLAQLKMVAEGGNELYAALSERTQALESSAKSSAKKLGLPIQINRVGSMMTLFFTDQPVTDYASAKTSDTASYGKYFRSLLEQGVYIAPSQFEALFLSAAHTDEDIDQTIKAVDTALRAVAND